MSWLSRLAERQMQKARLKGQLQGLAGEGKPLPDRSGDAFVSPGDAVGFRIMAEAGVLPEEIVLKKRIAALSAEMAALPEGPERQAMQAQLADLQMRAAMAARCRSTTRR